MCPTVGIAVKVTEEVRKNIEVRLKESAEFQTQLEKKLMEVEKEKQELQDDKRKAIESMEQQVNYVIDRVNLAVCIRIWVLLNSALVTSWFISTDIDWTQTQQFELCVSHRSGILFPFPWITWDCITV